MKRMHLMLAIVVLAVLAALIVSIRPTSAQIDRFAAGPPSVTLYTAPLLMSPGASSICSLVNVGATNIVDLVIRNHIKFEGTETLAIDVLEPGIPVSRNNINSFDVAEESWCEFEFVGSPSAVRASLCVIDEVGNCLGSDEAR